MTIGTRLRTFDDGAYRAGHTFGNRLFIKLVRLLFGVRLQLLRQFVVVRFVVRLQVQS